MQKKLVKLGLLLNLIVGGFAMEADPAPAPAPNPITKPNHATHQNEYVLPAMDGAVRAFRSEFDTEIRNFDGFYLATKTVRFINKLLQDINAGYTDKYESQFQTLTWLGYADHETALVRLGEAIRLGYGFNKGLVRVALAPTEQAEYLAAFQGIRSHVSADSVIPNETHVHTTDKTMDKSAILAHLSATAGNPGLAHGAASGAASGTCFGAGVSVGGAEPDTAVQPGVRFIYAPAKLVMNKALEAILTFSDEDIDTKTQRGLGIVKELLEVKLTAEQFHNREILERLVELDEVQRKKIKTWYAAMTGEEDITRRAFKAIRYSFLPNMPNDYEGCWNKDRTSIWVKLSEGDQFLINKNAMPPRKRALCDALGISDPFIYDFLASTDSREDFLDLLEIAALLDDATQRNAARKDTMVILKLFRISLGQILNIPDDKFEELKLAIYNGIKITDSTVQAIIDRPKELGALTENDYRIIACLSNNILWHTFSLGITSQTLQNAAMFYKYGIGLYPAGVTAIAERVKNYGNFTEADCGIIHAIVNAQSDDAQSDDAESDGEETYDEKRKSAVTRLIQLSSEELREEHFKYLLSKLSSEKQKHAQTLQKAGVSLLNYVVEALRNSHLTDDEISTVAAIVGAQDQTEKLLTAQTLLRLSPGKLRQAKALHEAELSMGWFEIGSLATTRDLTDADIKEIIIRVNTGKEWAHKVLKSYAAVKAEPADIVTAPSAGASVSAN